MALSPSKILAALRAERDAARTADYTSRLNRAVESQDRARSERASIATEGVAIVAKSTLALAAIAATEAETRAANARRTVERERESLRELRGEVDRYKAIESEVRPVALASNKAKASKATAPVATPTVEMA